MKTNLIKRAAVVSIAKESGKRVGSEFVRLLDLRIEELVRSACECRNGGRKTLDAEIARFSGCAPKAQSTAIAARPRKR